MPESTTPPYTPFSPGTRIIHTGFMDQPGVVDSSTADGPPDSDSSGAPLDILWYRYTLTLDDGSQVVDVPASDVRLERRPHDDVLDSALRHGAARDTTNPDDLDLTDLSEAERRNLPAGFHRPYWHGLATPGLWICAVCWGDTSLTRFPCDVATAHGAELAKAAGLSHDV